jgi:hypothetical protein
MVRARSALGNHATRKADASTLIFTGVFALVAISVAVVVGPHPTTAATPNRVLGVYAGAAYPPAVRGFAATIGSKPRFAMDFIDGTSWRSITQYGYPYSKWKGKGYSMIWGVDMLLDTYSPNTNPSQPAEALKG